MTAESGQAEFVLEGNRLTVRGEVGLKDEARYAEALFKLLETELEELVIDLTGLDYLSSGYVGAMCLLAHAATRAKRSVLVIASPEVGHILTITGLDKLVMVRIESGEPPSVEYAIHGNALVVRGNVFDDKVDALQAAAQKLVGTKHKDLVIDMSSVARIRGSHLGVLAATLASAEQEGCSVTIIAAKAVRSLLDAVDFCSLGKVRIIPAGQPTDEVEKD